MDLAELKFVVDTKQLEDAAKKIDALATSVSKVNKPITAAALESEKLALAQAKVAEAAAKAETAQVKLEQAQTKGAQATGKSTNLLEHHNLILKYQAEGNSKGQASILATAKAAGMLDHELLELNKTLVLQRTLMGTEPFDNSIGLHQKLQNQTKITEEVTDLFNRSLGLTEKQMVDLAREKQRLIALYGIEGKSLDGLAAEYEQIVQMSMRINQANDARTNGMKSQLKAQSDAAKANAYLADADARLAAALSDTNKALDKQATDALVKYEKALKQTGMASDEAAAKLAVAKKQFEGIAEKKQADRLQYLARAISVQMGDVGISLASGMNPLLVMIQQGDQIRGAIQQAGASGKELERAMAGAATQIATSFLQTGQAIGGFFVNAVKSAGKAIVDLPISVASSAIGALTGNVETSAAAFDRLKVAAISFGRVGIVAVIATLAALAIEYVKVTAAEKELTKSLAMSGAALGMSTTDAIAYAQSMNAVGIGTMDAMRMIGEFANAGADVSIPLKEIISSAQDMQKYVGIASADTMKSFADISEKPVEGLIKLAKSTGNVTAETILQAEAAVKAGKNAEAARIAQQALSNSNDEVVKRMKNNLDPLQTLWLDIKTGISKAGEALYDFLKNSTTVAVFRTVWETISVIVTEVWYVLKQTGNEISGIFSQIKAVMSGDFAGAAKIGDQMKIDAAAARVEQDKLIASILNRNKAEKETLSITEEQRVANRKAAKEIEDRIKKDKAAKPTTAVPASKDIAIIQKDYKEQLKLAESFAKDERSVLKARFDAGIIDRAEFIISDTALLVRSEEKQLAVIEQSRAKYTTAYEAQSKALNDALGNTKDEDNRKVLKTSIENLKKDFDEFNSTLDDTKNKIGSAFSAREQVALLEFEKAAFASTKTFEQYVKTQEDAAENKRIDLELQDRLTNAYGAEAASIRAVAEETKRQTADMSKFSKAQEDAYNQYLAVLNNPSSSLAQLEAAGGAYTTAMINANKAIAISKESITQAGTDAEVKYYKQEHDRINQEITDALVNSLGKGWKTAGEALRAALIAELKKPITVIVKAVVDVVSSGISGSLNSMLGGKAGSTLGDTIMSKISGIAMGGTTVGAAVGAFGQGVASGFSMGAPVASMGAPTSAAFNAGAAAAPIAGAAAGIAANKIISQDYEISKTMTNLQNVATVAAAFIPGLGPLVALGVGVVSGLANRAFGMKAKQITGEGIVGVLTTQGADVKAFEDWFQKGGWFRSNKSGRNLSAVSSSLQEYLDTSLFGLTAITKNYADVLGLESKDIDGVTKAINLNLKGLSAEDRQKKIDEALGGFGDELAKKLGFESFDALQKLGEQVLKERYDLETQLLTLQGNTVALRARERDQIYETNKDLFDQVKALEMAKPILEEKTKLEQELAILQGKTTQQTIDRSKLLSDENRLIYDQINAAKDKQKADEEAVKAMEKLTSVTTTIVDEINRLRGVNTSQSGLESQFAILTAQARSGDLNALAQLPEVTKGLEQIAASTAVNATDIIFARARLAQSLQDTLGYTGGFTASATTSMASIPSVSTSGIVASSNVTSASSNQELLAALVTEVQGLRVEVRADVSHNAKTAKILERANQDGETLSVSATIDGGVV